MALGSRAGVGGPRMSTRSPPSGDASAELAALEPQVLDHFFELQPGVAVFLGLHAYDGRVWDPSRGFTERWAAQARRLLEGLQHVAPELLPPAQRLDRLLLRLLLEGPLFDLEEGRVYDRNPMTVLGPISVTSYLVREYAPAPQRARAVVATLEAVPRLLEEGRRRLDAHLPRPFLTLTESMASGLPGHFAEAEAFVHGADPSLGGRFASARSAAEAALDAFMTRLRTDYAPRANDDFALGRERFQRLLWVREGMTLPVEELLQQGMEDLRRNQARLQALAAASRPARDVPALLEETLKDHPTAAELLPRAQALVLETRAFVKARRLVTIPEPDHCRVEETPVYGRALSTASMNPPGPFEAGGDEGVYYVTPVDPAWTPKQTEEWLRSFNDGLLRNITVHEVYPGHYLQFLHLRRSGGSRTRKVFVSDAFTEGWAHYAEQLAVENGLDGGSVRAQVAQLHDALLRDVRLLVSIGLHTQGRDLAWATAQFEQEAYFEQLPAQREALRGTYNPEYYCYTLGKLAILRARGELLERRFGGSLQRFHDALLSFGAPPVGMLEELLTG